MVNNFWYNCKRVIFQGVNRDYNAYYNSGNQFEKNMQIIINNPFIDYDNHDYRLSLPTDSGIPLDSPFNYDMDGNERGVDSNWDRGAFEFIKK